MCFTWSQFSSQFGGDCILVSRGLYPMLSSGVATKLHSDSSPRLSFSSVTFWWRSSISIQTRKLDISDKRGSSFIRQCLDCYRWRKVRIPLLRQVNPVMMQAQSQGLPALEAFAPPLISPLCCFNLQQTRTSILPLEKKIRFNYKGEEKMRNRRAKSVVMPT